MGCQAVAQSPGRADGNIGIGCNKKKKKVFIYGDGEEVNKSAVEKISDPISRIEYLGSIQMAMWMKRKWAIWSIELTISSRDSVSGACLPKTGEMV
jgi:hypothetical protein